MSNTPLPRVFALDHITLTQAKRRLAGGDPSYDAPLGQLEIEAEQALQEGPFPVTHKAVLPPSRDKHDYMSLARYYWSNPDAPNGLPYISPDGQVNP